MAAGRRRFCPQRRRRGDLAAARWRGRGRQRRRHRRPAHRRLFRRSQRRSLRPELRGVRRRLPLWLRPRQQQPPLRRSSCWPRASSPLGWPSSALSLAFTTYQTGKLFLLGLQPDGRLALFERTFDRAMGLGRARPAALPLAPSTSSGASRTRSRRARCTRATTGSTCRSSATPPATSTSTTSRVDGDGRVVFVNTLFGCLATPSERTASRRCGGRPSSAAWRPRTAAT